LKAEVNLDRYQGSVFEIQVASVLMHGWSEVEHDLVYKPKSGKLSDEEYAILDEINGLVIAGEIGLERLQKAMISRVAGQREIKDQFDVKSYLANFIGDMSNMDLGDLQLVTDFLSFSNNLNRSSLKKYMKNIDTAGNGDLA